MDQFLFEKVININKEINLLKEIQEVLSTPTSRHLAWCTDDGREIPVLSLFQRGVIMDILKRHDTMMRQEIQDEITKLENEIEAL